MERSSRKHRDSDRTSKHADDHHRSKHRDTDGDRRRRSEPERSEDREGSKDRESRGHQKRKAIGDSEDEDRYKEVRDKRVRVSDERKERRRFEVRVAAVEDERDRAERKERRRFEDTVNKEDMDVGETVVEDEPVSVSGANGGTPGSRSKALGTPDETPSLPGHSLSKINGCSSKEEGTVSC